MKSGIVGKFFFMVLLYHHDPEFYRMGHIMRELNLNKIVYWNPAQNLKLANQPV
jgi:hypothetical protein